MSEKTHVVVPPPFPPATSASTTTLERDPVCGMSVNPATAKHTYEHGGKKFYFCCGGCVERFKANPEGYLSMPASGLVMPGMAPTVAKVSAARDAVCGMSVNPETAKHAHE